MIIREEYLVTINAKNRIQRIRVQLDQNPYGDVYSILRMTGQYGGKETDQPVLFIKEGKAKRTVAQQASLQYNHIVEEYLNKGYVKLSLLTKKKYSELTEDEIKELLGGDFVSDTSGVPKPMLAKLGDQCVPDVWEQDLYVSRKLDGEPKNLCRR